MLTARKKHLASQHARRRAGSDSSSSPSLYGGPRDLRHVSNSAQIMPRAPLFRPASERAKAKTESQDRVAMLGDIITDAYATETLETIPDNAFKIYASAQKVSANVEADTAQIRQSAQIVHLTSTLLSPAPIGHFSSSSAFGTSSPSESSKTSAGDTETTIEHDPTRQIRGMFAVVSSAAHGLLPLSFDDAPVNQGSPSNIANGNGFDSRSINAHPSSDASIDTSSNSCVDGKRKDYPDGHNSFAGDTCIILDLNNRPFASNELTDTPLSGLTGSSGNSYHASGSSRLSFSHDGEDGVVGAIDDEMRVARALDFDDEDVAPMKPEPTCLLSPALSDKDIGTATVASPQEPNQSAAIRSDESCTSDSVTSHDNHVGNVHANPSSSSASSLSSSTLHEDQGDPQVLLLDLNIPKIAQAAQDPSIIVSSVVSVAEMERRFSHLTTNKASKGASIPKLPDTFLHKEKNDLSSVNGSPESDERHDSDKENDSLLSRLVPPTTQQDAATSKAKFDEGGVDPVDCNRANNECSTKKPRGLSSPYDNATEDNSSVRGKVGGQVPQVIGIGRSPFSPVSPLLEPPSTKMAREPGSNSDDGTNGDNMTSTDGVGTATHATPFMPGEDATLAGSEPTLSGLTLNAVVEEHAFDGANEIASETGTALPAFWDGSLSEGIEAETEVSDSYASPLEEPVSVKENVGEVFGKTVTGKISHDDGLVARETLVAYDASDPLEPEGANDSDIPEMATAEEPAIAEELTRNGDDPLDSGTNVLPSNEPMADVNEFHVVGVAQAEEAAADFQEAKGIDEELTVEPDDDGAAVVVALALSHEEECREPEDERAFPAIAVDVMATKKQVAADPLALPDEEESIEQEDERASLAPDDLVDLDVIVAGDDPADEPVMSNELEAHDDVKEQGANEAHLGEEQTPAGAVDADDVDAMVAVVAPVEDLIKANPWEIHEDVEEHGAEEANLYGEKAFPAVADIQIVAVGAAPAEDLIMANPWKVQEDVEEHGAEEENLYEELAFPAVTDIQIVDEAVDVPGAAIPLVVPLVADERGAEEANRGIDQAPPAVVDFEIMVSGAAPTEVLGEAVLWVVPDVAGELGAEANFEEAQDNPDALDNDIMIVEGPHVEEPVLDDALVLPFVVEQPDAEDANFDETRADVDAVDVVIMIAEGPHADGHVVANEHGAGNAHLDDAQAAVELANVDSMLAEGPHADEQVFYWMAPNAVEEHVADDANLGEELAIVDMVDNDDDPTRDGLGRFMLRAFGFD